MPFLRIISIVYWMDTDITTWAPFLLCFHSPNKATNVCGLSLFLLGIGDVLYSTGTCSAEG